MRNKSNIQEEIKDTAKEKKLKIAEKLKLKVLYENRIGSTQYTSSQGCC